MVSAVPRVVFVIREVLARGSPIRYKLSCNQISYLKPLAIKVERDCVELLALLEHAAHLLTQQDPPQACGRLGWLPHVHQQQRGPACMRNACVGYSGCLPACLPACLRPLAAASARNRHVSQAWQHVRTGTRAGASGRCHHPYYRRRSKAHGGPLSTTYLTTACGAIHAYAGERCNVNPGALRGEGVRRRRRRAAERPPAERIQPLNLDVGGDCGGIMAAAGVGGGGGSGSCSAAVGLAPA